MATPQSGRAAALLALILPLVLCSAAPGAEAQHEALLRELNARPHSAPLTLLSAQTVTVPFSLAPDHPRPVLLYLQAVLRYRTLSHSGGVLRLAVNGTALGAADSPNKSGEYWTRGTGMYAPQAFALPAQPSLDAGAREDLGGLGYLFDLTRLAKPGPNTLSITHVAATDAVLLRDALLLVGSERQALVPGTPAVASNDPRKLRWDFAPNLKEGKGLFLCQGVFQRVNFYLRNDDTAGAVRLALALELPAGVELVTPYLPCADGWSTRLRLDTSRQQRNGQEYTRYTLTLPAEAAAAPETQWHSFGGHPLSLYLRCRTAPGVYRLYWQSHSQGGEGEPLSAPLTVLPALPPTPQPRRSLLGVWAYRVVQPAVSPGEQPLEALIRRETDAQLQAVGVSRLVLSDKQEIAAARAHGLLVSLASMWSYDTTVYPTATADRAQACLGPDGSPVRGDKRPGLYQWCPTYAAAHVAEVFGPITQRLASEGWDGFDLDHEGEHHQCFCPRCQEAFLQREKLAAAEVRWPQDVAPGGRLREPWLRFHCFNGGRHVAAIREAVKAGNPQARLFSWFTMSLYERQATGPHVAAYGRRLQEEAEYGYDPREFLRHLDLASMANGVYAQGEDTWQQPYGLTWAFERVERTVDNPWGVPLAPCLNIGAGVHDNYTNPDYLRWQAKTHLAQGVRGLDFWMLPFLDGRHYALLSELGRLLQATQDVVWEGRRADDLVTVSGPPGLFHRAFASPGKLLLALTNRGTQPARVTVRTSASGGVEVLSGARESATIIVPPLDGSFVLYRLP